MESEVEIYNDEPRAGTFLISIGFGREHFKVLRLIERYKTRFLRLENKRSLKSLIKRRVPIKTAGRPVDEIMLNRKQFFFLGTLFRNSDRVLDFKEKLANDFVQQQKLIDHLLAQRQSSEWISNRATGKLLRHKETDTIKDFIKYAKAQGSKNADKYYIILSNCVNNNLFIFNGNFKNKREALSPIQLLQVGSADTIVSRFLIEGMAQSLPYKEIYKLVRDKVIALSDLIGKSEVIAAQLPPQIEE